MKQVTTKHSILIVIILLTGLNFSCKQSSNSSARIPVIYSTDLYHPPQDPDDHYDLAILSSLEELELKALIFDVATSSRKPEEYGKTALEQISKITGKKLPPYKIGLRNPLQSLDDKALNQPKEFQGGVELILSTLKKSKEQVVMFLVGSCRDFAVAFNREPELLKKKVKAVYVNAGNGPKGLQTEWNVTLDPNAYLRLMTSGLPIYWCPCITDDYRLPSKDEVLEGKAFCTYYIVPNQAELLASTRTIVKNFFAYALNNLKDEPLSFLNKEAQTLPESARNMWCTGPFLHAAGRKIQKDAEGKYFARHSDAIENASVSKNGIDVFRFEPTHFASFMVSEKDKVTPFFHEAEENASITVQIFRYTHPDFNDIMTSILKELLESL